MSKAVNMQRVVGAVLILALILTVGVGLRGNEEDRLQNALLHTWNESYRAGVYDCSNLACFVAAYLQEIKGYDTSVVGNDTTLHAWVRVKKTEGTGGYYMVEPAFVPLHYIGQIVKGPEYRNYDYAYEWYEYMNIAEKDYNDLWESYEELRHKYNRLIKQYNDLVGKYNRLRG